MSLLIYKMFNNINMNFFNAQFLILIGIIIVIYFLYKEINFLHKKINKLQDLIENKSINSNINLSNNFIENIDPLLFKDLFYLEIIDLSNNRLKKIILGLFHGLPYIKTVNLKNNHNIFLEKVYKNINFVL